ncbi:MAG: trypsin-like peptidase domain-containing protein [Candidatus Riflebacteria bacterium]|nr:trypsin-like peptidase domain-containing protein [Candidatus Riflebacteria bacterium]
MAKEREDLNGNIIVALVAILVFIIIGLVFWYRQNQRDLVEATLVDNQVQTRAVFVNDRPAGVPNVGVPNVANQRFVNVVPKSNSSLKPKSYKQILETISPSIVSIEAEQEAEEPVPFTTAPQQNPQNTQARMPTNRPGQQAAGTANRGIFLVCPNDGTRIPNPQNIPSNVFPCPVCGTRMEREGHAVTTPTVKSGSGVIVHRDGYILTNLHIVKEARNINVTISYSPLTEIYPAELIDEAPDMDLAIIKILNTGREAFIPAPIGDSSLISTGDKVICIGGLFGLQQSVTSGIISNPNRTLTLGGFELTNLIQIDAAVNYETSGGPLVNSAGQVIGINTAIYFPNTNLSGIGFAVPINYAISIFPDFIEGGNTRNRLRNAAAQISGVQPNLQNAAAPRGTGQNPWCPPATQNVALQQPLPQNAAAPRGTGQNPLFPPNPQNAAFPACPPGGQFGVVPRGSGLNAWCPPNMRPVALPVNQVQPTVAGVVPNPADPYVAAKVGGNTPTPSVRAPMGGNIQFRPNATPPNQFAQTQVRRPQTTQPQVMQPQIGQPQTGQQQAAQPPVAVANNAAEAPEPPEPPEVAGVPEPPEPPAAAAAREPPEPAAVPEAPEPPAAQGVDPATIPLTGMLVGAEAEVGAIGALDMNIEEITPQIAATYALPPKQEGLVVAEVEGIARTAGFQVGDVIISANNQPIKNVVDFITVLNQANPQVGANFDVARKGKLLTIHLKG